MTDKPKDHQEKLKDYLVKDEAYGQIVKDKILPALIQAIEQFSVEVKNRTLGQKHKDFVMTVRIQKKLQDREGEKSKMREELKLQMGDEYEEDEDAKDDDEDSMFDEEEKEFYDKGID